MLMIGPIDCAIMLLHGGASLETAKILDNYKQAYEELKLILDLSFDQITIADGNAIFTKVSKSCEPYFGVSEKELIGVSAFELEKNGVFDVSVTAEVLRKGKQITLIQKTGAGKTLMVTGIPIFDEDRNITKIINISKDITENQLLSDQFEELKSKLQWFQKELHKRQTLSELTPFYKSVHMEKTMSLIDHISDLDTTVLLLGETGTGKGYLARVIHDCSLRKEEPFVTINCGAIPENLLESELFGYEAGAFSGASKGGKKGLFEIAGKGTIFLDEIGDMPLSLQVKLLHVLDGKAVFRVGGEKAIPIQGRIIVATNKDLKTSVEKGEFRRDLYYRLNIVPITIAPLRERKEDVPGLIRIFLDRFNKEHCAGKCISESGYKALLNYDYPGNIRELENIIERLVITTLEDVIDDSHVAEITGSQKLNPFLAEEIMPIRKAVENLERHILQSAMEKYQTTRKVAEVLEIDQSTVVKKLQKLKIKY